MSVYRKRNATSPIAVVLGLLVTVVLVVAAGYGIYAHFHAETFDKVTLCPSNGAKGQYVVLIDNTSPFPFTQKAALKQRLREMVINDIPTGAMLTVFVLGEDFKHEDEPVFEKCSPGQWVDGEGMTKTKKFVDKDFNDKFAKPLEAVVNQIPLDVRGKTSPIFEMLQIASIRGFGHDNAKGDKTLIVYSDMAANTAEFTMYKNPQLNYKDFSKTPYVQRVVAPALEGASVTINMMATEPSVTPYVKRSEFWAQYFSANKASLDHVNPMEGL
jgi:hypothetical protein